jgi:hypothetical protein
MYTAILCVSLLARSFLDTSVVEDNTGFYDSSATNQITVATSNIHLQPAWGPAGYDYVDYYYLPDIETYYCVKEHQYIYYTNFHWVFSKYPPRYREIDLYNCYKVVVNQQKPYLQRNSLA